jgi:aryl-alcohol dehydrogenase-like predicted oxidoreductase
MMIALRDEGLIAGVGLSTVSVEQVLHAAARTEIVCVQNPYNLLNRKDERVLRACAERGIAYVPFFPLGSAFARPGVLTHPAVIATAERLGATPAQIALAWVLAIAPNTLLIPGTSSLAHLEENLGAGEVELDADALALLDAVRE